MRFFKAGQQIFDAITKRVAADREIIAQHQHRFEREKEKSALALIRELEEHIERLERILRHTDPEQSYQITEQDLADFGFE